MKDCEMIQKRLCLGCTGLAEEDWVGKEQCKRYQVLSKLTGLEQCKQIIEQMKMEGTNEIYTRNKR